MPARAALRRPAPQPVTTTRWGLLFVAVASVAGLLGLAGGLTLALVALTIAGFAGAVVGLRWPVVGLLSVGILCTIDSLTRVYLMTGHLLRWNTFNYWLLAVMFLCAPLLLRLRDVHSRLLQALLALLALEISFSPDVKLGMLHVLNGGVMFGLLAYVLRGARQAGAWYWFALVNGVTACGVGAAFYLHPGSLALDAPAASPGALATIDANSLCQSLLTAIFTAVLACSLGGVSPRGTMLLGTLAFVNSAWVFLSGSRSTTLLAACCLLVMLAIIPGLGRRLVLLVLAGALAGAIAWQFPAFHERMLHRIDKMTDSRLSATQRTHGRWDLAAAGWHIFRENPFGVGTGGYARTLAKIEGIPGVSGRFVGHKKASHNVWLKTLAENGIPGFLLLAAYVGSFALAGWKRRRAGLLPIGLLAFACITIAFMTSEFQAKSTWLLAAGATALLWYPPRDDVATRHDS